MDTNGNDALADLAALAARLFPPVSDADGIPEAPLADAEVRLGLPLPPLLRAVYRLCGRRDDLLRATDRLIPPEFLTVADEVLVFLADATGSRYAGVRAQEVAANDPPVVVSGIGNKAAWKPARYALSDALRALLVTNAAQGGMYWSGAAEVSPEALNALGPDWERVAGAEAASGRDATPPFFLRDGLVLHAVPAKKGKVLVCAGAGTAGWLQELSEILGTPWTEKRRRPDAPPEADEGLVDEHADARLALRQRAAASAAGAAQGATCAGCGGLLRTWADNGRGVCGLCGHPLPAGGDGGGGA